jgi:hypothetical protein
MGSAWLETINSAEFIEEKDKIAPLAKTWQTFRKGQKT